MQNNEIALFQKFGLAKNSNFNYSEAVNAFIGIGKVQFSKLLQPLGPDASGEPATHGFS